MRGEGANEKIHDVLTQVTLSPRGLLQADVPLLSGYRTVIEKWMEETTNPMMFMQSMFFSEAARVPHTLHSSHACLILMPPPQIYIYTCNVCNVCRE